MVVVQDRDTETRWFVVPLSRPLFGSLDNISSGICGPIHTPTRLVVACGLHGNKKNSYRETH